jgi:gliding motility-associated-like protein
MVYPQGISDVRILDTVQCLYGNDFSFGNDSKITGASFSIMSWNFGDGIIDTAYRTEPISHSYNDTGIYQVELISTTEHLCTDISTGFVRVVPMPVAKLSLNQYGYCFNEQQFELVDVSVKDSTSANRWIYGNSESDNLDTLRPTFDRVGKYRVRLVEYTNFGCSDTTETMLVVNKIPMARIAVNINEQCLEKNEFLFRNASIDADEPMEFWDFGDGAFGSGNEVNQTYSESGDFEVILVVENDSNCLDTAMLSVRVNPTPEAALLIDPSCEGQPVNIASGSSISEGFINQYEWNMGDGRNYFFEQPEHTYNKPGKYYVTLAMTSDEGCYAKYIDSTNVYANPTAQMSAFTQRATILKPQVTFLDSSVDAASYEWDFGDGSDFAFDYEAIHEYADTGLYKTRLVVSSADGCLDTTYANVRVWPDFNILLPTAFSPNGDLSNDAYRIRGNHHSIAIAEWQIYTDDGIKVFESNDITASWDGTFNEQPLPMGNYQLVLIVKDIFGKQAQFNEKISLVR